MNNQKDSGVYQLDNGYWGYRYKVKIDGKFRESRRTTDESGKPFKTKTAAVKARKQAIVNEKIQAAVPQAMEKLTDLIFTATFTAEQAGFEIGVRFALKFLSGLLLD